MTEYYIDPSLGDDNLAGTSIATAWRTETNVNGGSFSAGDAIYIKKGETLRGELIIPSSGTETLPIVVSTYGDDDDPIISGSDVAHGFHIGSNLLLNPSFEDWTAGVPDDWTEQKSGTSDVVEETVDVFAGSSALSIEYDATPADAYITLTTPLALTDNKKYRLSLWHKDPQATSGSDLSFLAITIFRTGGAGVDEYLAPNFGLPVPGDEGHWTGSDTTGMPVSLSPWWAPYQIDFDTGANGDAHTDYYVKISAYAKVPFNVYASKNFLVDAVSLVLLPTEAIELTEDGAFENWTAGALDSWTEALGETGSDITQETTDPYAGASSVNMLVADNGNFQTSIELYQSLDQTLTDNTDYTVSITHKMDETVPAGEIARLAVVIWRNDGAPPGEYLQPDGVTWKAAPAIEVDHAGVPLTQAGTTYITDTITFNTGTKYDPGYTTYWVGVAPWQPKSGQIKFNTAGRTFTFDSLSIKKTVVGEGNELANWSFEDWTSGAPDNWTVVQDGDTTLAESDDYRHGDASVKFTADDDDNDVGVKQTGISLDASTDYRFGCFAHTLETSAAKTLEVAIQIIRESDTYYWTGSTWSATETDAVSYHPRDWELVAEEFTTEAGADTYTFYIHRAEGTATREKEEMWVDMAFLQEDAVADEVWVLDYDEVPGHIWATGTINSEVCDHTLLHNESQTSKQTGEYHPHFMGWTYDNVNNLLYINVGQDPGSIAFECSSRDTCLDANGEDWITFDGIQCYRPKRFGVAMSYKTSAPRSTGIETKNCTVKYPGETGILAGYQPPLPYEGGILPGEDHLTPSETVFEGNDVFRYGDGAPFSIRCADDEILTDPDFEDWASGTVLNEWDVTLNGATQTQVTDDVWRGSSSVKFTCTAGGACPQLIQDDIYGLFIDTTPSPTARVSIWYKTPDWDGSSAGQALFAIFVRRHDSSGTATGPVLNLSGVFEPAGNGIPLAQSLTWTNYTLTFDRPADYLDYPIYSFAISGYGPTAPGGLVNQTFLFDQASLSEGWTNWGGGGSYGCPTAGIMVAGGDGSSGGAGNVTVEKNFVDGKQAMINTSAGKNGIVLRNGGGTVAGSLALVQKNEVTRSAHAIVAIGQFSDQTHPTVPENPYPYVTNIQIKHNFVHDTGDDGIWVDGLWWAGSKICYNVISNTGDNCLDYWNSAGVEIYNNSFYQNFNEALSMAGELITGLIDTYAFVYNNIFHNWGDDWVIGTPGLQRGAAIGFYLTNGTNNEVGFSLIDNNMYYLDSDTTLSGYPFHVTAQATGLPVQKTWAEWLAYGFDANSTIDDPEYSDPDNDNLTIARASPCFETGLDLSNLDAEIDVPYFLSIFDKDGAETDGLSSRSTFPADVRFTTQDTLWEIGAYGDPTPTIIDDSATFPTDGSLYGVTAYVVDTSTQRIWKGSIIENTGTEIYLDEWESMFNAEGVYPGGSLPYYIGYIFLYDKTPQHAFINDHWGKRLTEHELLLNNVATSNFIFFRRGINHGSEYTTEAATLLGDRVAVRVTGGYHRNFQHEHALVTNQAIHVKEMIYHGVWTRGKIDK